jgi:hypothetical protein
MKQRRRWMNGSLFGTSKILWNFIRMLGFGTSHPWYSCVLMLLYLPYQLCVFLLNFFLVGSLFTTIDVFFKQTLISITKYSEEQISPYYHIFSWSYFLMLMLCTFVSLALPINRAMIYLYVISCIICSLFVLSLAGVVYLMNK